LEKLTNNRSFETHQTVDQTKHQLDLPGWNATQFKLSIINFLNSEPGVESLFWFDSDLIFFYDISDFLLQFSLSPRQCHFFFVADHVMFQNSFLENWEKHHKFRPFIPQACLMGFKTSIIRQFFQLWHKHWLNWISPKPFSNHPDPNQEFSDSSFCCEQYALGTALREYLNSIPSDLRQQTMMQFDRTVMSIAGDSNSITLGNVQTISGESKKKNFDNSIFSIIGKCIWKRKYFFK